MAGDIVRLSKNTEKLWIDTRLNEVQMDFLWDVISTEENNSDGVDWKENAGGNVSRCDIKDKDNWFYETVLKKLTERMFCWDWDAYRKYIVDQEESLPEFELQRLWVNYQKKYDHVPIHNHNHGALFSFVVFMKIPTYWKEQHVLPLQMKSDIITLDSASDFQFVWSEEKDSQKIVFSNFLLSPEDEGRILFFPSFLYHQVYPFYGTTESEERITISGNIQLYDSNRLKMQEISGNDVYKDFDKQEKMLEMLENHVIIIKKELKQMKKEREKEE